MTDPTAPTSVHAAEPTAVPTAAPPTALFVRAMTALEDLRGMVVSHERITSDEHGVLMAMSVALRADCTRRRVGAVIVDVTGRVVGTGRNGAPPGRPGCLSAGACPRGQTTYAQIAPGSSYSAGAGHCIALHAEVNAVLYSASPQARAGGTIFVSDAPCNDCFKVLVGSGLARVVWPEAGPDGTWVLRSRSLTEGPIGGLYD